MGLTQSTNIFVIARERGWDWHEMLDLSVNTNPLGPAPGVRAAIERALDRIGYYPDPRPILLVERLAHLWELEPDHILMGNGATEMIHFTARMWMRETATLAVPTYTEYLRAHPMARHVPWNEPGTWAEDAFMIVAQPNPYTGQLIAWKRLRQFLLRTHNPVLVDETQIEFCDEPSVLPLVGQRPSLFVLRSMSNFYALPGLRVGMLAGDPANMASLREKREPWQVNALAKAAALAALDDVEHAERSRSLIYEERKWMWSELQRIPAITPVRSEANFFLIYLTSGAGELCRWFLDRKVILLNCGGVPGIEGDAIRLAVRTRPENERVVGLLREYFCG